MALTLIKFSIALILLGFIAYFGFGRTSMTALIPSLFGALMLVCGLLAQKENLRKHIMHVAILFALIGLIGSFPGVRGLFKMLMGENILRPTAAIVQSTMFFILLIYIILSVRSFILARKSDKS